MSKEYDEIVVGLDIGTSKIAAVVGTLTTEGTIEVLGIGTHESIGLKKGIVSNIDDTVASIQHAIDEAELMSSHSIDSVYVGIAGAHIDGKKSDGTTAIITGEVTEYDIDRVLDAAKAIAIPSDQKVLHVLPKQYTIDGQSGIIEPLGMSGVRLETDVYIVTGSITATKNIIKCVEKCGLSVNEVVLEQLASSYAVLSDAEKDAGVCLVDIGGGTTDIAVFYRGTIRHTSNIPIAGDHVTNDIAIVFKMSKPQAEEIKVKHGCAVVNMVNSNEEITIPSLDEKTTRKLSRQSLAEVIGMRYLELLEMVQAELRRSGFEHVVTNGGLVLTGGCSRIEGAVEVAEEIFNVPVKIGRPKNIVGLVEVVSKPNFATSVGLLQYGIKFNTSTKSKPSNKNNSVFKTIIAWFKDNF